MDQCNFLNLFNLSNDLQFQNEVLTYFVLKKIKEFINDFYYIIKHLIIINSTIIYST